MLKIENEKGENIVGNRGETQAVDMDAIIKSVLFGQGERYEEIGKGSTGYDPNLKPYPYDPAKAKALLAEAGYPNGFKTRMEGVMSGSQTPARR